MLNVSFVVSYFICFQFVVSCGRLKLATRPFSSVCQYHRIVSHRIYAGDTVLKYVWRFTDCAVV